METSFATSGQVWSSERGEFISQDHARLASTLQDYNPNLSLVYIPMKDRTVTDTKPFAILESRPGFPPQIIRYLSESDMLNPQSILAWVFDGDVARHGVSTIMSRIENAEAAERLLALKRQEDDIEDRIELSAFLVSGGRNKLHTVKHNGQKFEV